MPYVEANFAAMFESSGVCDTRKTLGVDIDAKVGIDLSVQAATKGNEANPFWEQEIYVGAPIPLHGHILIVLRQVNGVCFPHAWLLDRKPQRQGGW